MKDKLTELGQLFWQFEIAGVPLPRLVVQGVVGRREGEWWLKVWGERLLFYSHGLPDRVFAVTMPYNGEHDMSDFWRVAVANGNYGAMSMNIHCASQLTGEWTTFINIHANNGILQSREWCFGPWIAHEELLPPNSNLRLDMKEPGRWRVFDTLIHRPFPSEARHSHSLSWLRGSQKEWMRVLQSCATLLYAKNRYSGMEEYLESGRHIYVALTHTPFHSGHTDNVESWALPERWEQLFNKHFVCVGWEWRSGDNGNSETRAGWRAYPLTVSAELQLTLQPSQHQQLEARLYLRDWLRGKVPDAHIAKLLE